MAKKGTTRYKSNKQEKEVAKLFGGKQVIASGSLWFADSDVRSDKCLIECKTTEKPYYSVTSKVWEKIEREALKDGMRTPLLIVDLKDRDRVVVFNPIYFSADVPTPYDCSYNGDNKKSYRVSMKVFEDYAKEEKLYLYGKLFVICGEKKNLLCYMRLRDFIEAFKEEI